MPSRHAGRSGGSSLTNSWCGWLHVCGRWRWSSRGLGRWSRRLKDRAPRCVSSWGCRRNCSGRCLALGVLADVTVGGGVCPVCVACVAGQLSSGSCGVPTGVGPVTLVARSS